MGEGERFVQPILQPTRYTINNEQIMVEEDLINVMIDE